MFLEFWHCEDESSSCRCPNKVASHFPKRDTQAPEIHQSIRQHTSAYVSIHQQRECALVNTSAESFRSYIQEREGGREEGGGRMEVGSERGREGGREGGRE